MNPDPDRPIVGRASFGNDNYTRSQNPKARQKLHRDMRGRDKRKLADQTYPYVPVPGNSARIRRIQRVPIPGRFEGRYRRSIEAQDAHNAKLLERVETIILD